MTAPSLLSRPINVASVPEAGLAQRIEASPAEREAIATAFRIPEVKAFAAELDVTRGSGGSVVVDGRVTARIVQTCVVSLVAIEQDIDEPVHERLVPEGSRLAPPPPKPGSEIRLPEDVDDAPEVFSGETIDLGAIALEHFALGIDPYPRAPGAELPAEATDAGDASGSPFAALKALSPKRS